MKTYWGVEIQLHAFLTSALDESEWLASRLGRFTLGERALINPSIRDWVSPRAGLDVVAKKQYIPLPGIEPRSSNP
jgi:hypothetical protein